MTTTDTPLVVYRLYHPQLNGFSFIGSTSSSNNPISIKNYIISQHRHCIKKNEPRKEWYKLYENGLDPKELVLEIIDKCPKSQIYQTKQKWYKQYYPQTTDTVNTVSISPTVEPHEHQLCEDYKKRIEELKAENVELKANMLKISTSHKRLIQSFKRMSEEHQGDLETCNDAIQFYLL